MGRELYLTGTLLVACQVCRQLHVVPVVPDETTRTDRNSGRDSERRTGGDNGGRAGPVARVATQGPVPPGSNILYRVQHMPRSIGWGLGKSCSFRSLFCKSDVGPRLEAYLVKVAFGAWADPYLVKVAKIRRNFWKNGNFSSIFAKVASGNEALMPERKTTQGSPSAC